ncbi:hypothetical protein M422DRAFT_60599 [Sphaerobolus stellatus SS14]|uniref:Unplaced genomic scaffold SPHSTscaffold_70, whole genome shotgun sequence n=1 Tax=Sphaerobolus stellatus (strain SS14) TaxID=990650 RepID=A0A0C9VQ60_SPHS4|nr:hypothetical protein M422DRAFT_60599 [Sphaerobolus stellatus SS14]
MAESPTPTPSHSSLSPTLAAQTNPTITNEKERSKDTEATATWNAEEPRSLTTFQKITILTILCSAQFFDLFNGVSAIIALPQISDALHFSPGALQWVITAYTLTFAAFLLFAGRLTDIYHPKPVFCVGYLLLGITSILCAVSVQPIMLIVFRAIQGVGAAFTYPSALAMISHYFQDIRERNRAFALFGSFGAIGNVAGFIIGGVLTARVSWRWIFYLVGIVTIPFAVFGYFALPKLTVYQSSEKRNLDWAGVIALSGGLILFVYGISAGNDAGWAKPQIIVTLVFSVIFVVGFFVIERTVKDPAVPPRVWSTHNFLPLFLYCWSIYWTLNASELLLIMVFQDLWGWSALKAAVHCIPIGISGGISTNLAGVASNYLPRRVLLIGGQLLMAVAVILFALADTPDKYWSHVLPGMIIGLVGVSTGFVGANIFIMGDAAHGEEGVIGGLMNTAFQLGATVGLAGECLLIL